MAGKGSVKIEWTGLKELRQRFAQFPHKLDAIMRKTLETALYVIWEHVPPYPPKPEGTDYIRTGTLGRTLGSSEHGGQSGSLKPEIFTVKKLGAHGYEGQFGTRLNYAPHVIGEGTQARHMKHWWTIGTIARNATAKINRIFDRMAEEVARYLDKGA